MTMKHERPFQSQIPSTTVDAPGNFQGLESESGGSAGHDNASGRRRPNNPPYDNNVAYAADPTASRELPTLDTHVKLPSQRELGGNPTYSIRLLIQRRVRTSQYYNSTDCGPARQPGSQKPDTFRHISVLSHGH